MSKYNSSGNNDNKNISHTNVNNGPSSERGSSEGIFTSIIETQDIRTRRVLMM